MYTEGEKGMFIWKIYTVGGYGTEGVQYKKIYTKMTIQNP